MMKKIYWIGMVCCMLGLPFGISAQHQAVSIGQIVPDIHLQNILNGDGRDKLSDFYGEGKLLLIDFWATWCTACTRSFGKMAAIKDELGDAVEILAVTYESKEKIEEFFERYPELYKEQMLFLVGDTVLPKLFPLKMLPHVAWIGPGGKVLATTNTEEVTVESVRDAINGSVERLLIKEDIMDFDLGKNLEAGDDRFIARSVLTPYRPGIFSIGRREPFVKVLDRHYDNRLVRREIHMNTPIAFLYMYAAYGGHFLKHNKHMVILEIRDSSKVVYPPMYNLSNPDTWALGRERWSMNNSFCYELALPDAIPAREFRKYMMEDLNRYFPVYGTMEKRWMHCYVLTKVDNAIYDFKSSGKASEFVMDTSDERGTIDRLEHVTMDQFVTYLNMYNLGIPFLNETNVSIPLDLKIRMNKEMQRNLDVGYLKEKLREHGLGLHETKRLIEVLVIRDKE